MTEFAHRPVLRYDAAVHVVAEAVRAARTHGLEIAVSVLDASGRLLAYGRMDDGPLQPADDSHAKATAAISGRPVHGDACNLWGGGIPIVSDGLVAGAVGVAGGTAQQDEAVARQALRALLEADTPSGSESSYRID